MTKTFLVTLSSTVLVLLSSIFAASLNAESVKRQIYYSAEVKLRPSKPYTFRFSLWDSASEGAKLWSEEKMVKLNGKKLEHYLGSVDPQGNPLSVDYFSMQVWLEIERRQKGKWKPLGQRTRLALSPYSFVASSVEPGSIESASIRDGSIESSDLKDGVITDDKISGIIGASKIDTTISSHVGSTSNPHSVTAAQAGAAPASHSHDGYLSTGQTAAGDLSGIFPNPNVVALQGSPVSSENPSLNKVMKWNGSAWAPADDANSGGDITAVTPGDGLSGGAASGSASLAVNFAGDGAATTVSRSDHSHYSNTVIVGSVGTADQNGAALLSALNAISDASSTNSYLLKIEPGIYNVGSGGLTMKEYVDIEGSGEQATKVRGTSSSSNSGAVIGANNAEIRFLTIENTGGGNYAHGLYVSSKSTRAVHVTLIGSNGTFISRGAYLVGASGEYVSVTGRGSGGTYARGIEVNGGSPKLGDVSGESFNAGTSSVGIYFAGSSTADAEHIRGQAQSATSGATGIYLSNSAPSITFATAYAAGTSTSAGFSITSVSQADASKVATISFARTTGWGGTVATGAEISSSNVVFDNLVADASGGSVTNNAIRTLNTGDPYTIKITNSKLKSSSHTIGHGSDYSIYVGSSQMSGDVISGTGTVTCYGAYNEDFTNPGGISACP